MNEFRLRRLHGFVAHAIAGANEVLDRFDSRLSGGRSATNSAWDFNARNHPSIAASVVNQDRVIEFPMRQRQPMVGCLPARRRLD